MMTRDMKFKDEDIENFHFLALPFDRNLKTIRDLNETHLDLLKSIRD